MAEPTAAEQRAEARDRRKHEEHLADLSDALEVAREAFHAAREKGDVPPKALANFRNAQAALAQARTEWRKSEVATGRRGAGVGVGTGDAVVAPATVEGAVG